MLFTLVVVVSLLAAQNTFSTLATEAKAASDANRLDEAVVLYQKALKLRPLWAEGWFSIGTIQYDQNRYQEAADSFDKATRLTPKAGTARVMLGLCEFELGRDESALTHLQEGRRLGLADNQQLRDVALFHEGILLQRSGKFDAAEDSLHLLCQRGVANSELKATLGLAALRLRDKAAGGEIISEIGQAECLAGQKNFDGAEREYQALVAQNPNFPNVHYAFGRFLLATNRPAEAIEEFSKEIENQPQSALARLQIAAAKYKIDSAGGLPYAEAALKLDPRLPLGHYIYGLLLLDTDDYKRALPELELAEKTLSQEPGVYYALGVVYARVGRMEDAERARATFKRLKSEAPQP